MAEGSSDLVLEVALSSVAVTTGSEGPQGATSEEGVFSPTVAPGREVGPGHVVGSLQFDGQTRPVCARSAGYMPLSFSRIFLRSGIYSVDMSPFPVDPLLAIESPEMAVAILDLLCEGDPIELVSQELAALVSLLEQRVEDLDREIERNRLLISEGPAKAA